MELHNDSACCRCQFLTRRDTMSSKNMHYRCPMNGCDYMHANLNSLRVHCAHHGMSSMQMWIDVMCDGKRPMCMCGCDQFTKWVGIKHGFSNYVCGHNSRVNNNWGHNDIAQHKSQEIRASLHREGKIEVWNKGKTKHDDKRILNYGRKSAKTWSSARRHRQSTVMRAGRLDGSIRTLIGKDHPQWKGGATSVGKLVRVRKQYRTWHERIRMRHGFMCAYCDIAESHVKNSTLDVHHDVQQFSCIVASFINAMNPLHEDNFTLRSQVADAVAAYHVENDVSGIALCRTCHKEIHKSFNF